MLEINLKEIVQQAVGKEWQAFAADHPNLARVLDETLLVQEVTKHLQDDPEYQKALAEAEIAGQAAQKITELARELVGKWLNGIR